MNFPDNSSDFHSNAPSTGGKRMDREHIARFMISYEERIRAVARRNISAPTRNITDSEDIFGSVCRRVDEMANAGLINARSEAELWSLIKSLASNTSLEKVRLIERINSFAEEDGEYARCLIERLSQCASDDDADLLIRRIAAKLRPGADRQMLFLLLRGANHRVIGEHLGFSEEASRQRWAALRTKLCDVIKRLDNPDPSTG